MTLQQYKRLWEKIRDFPINDPGSSFTFTDKLQKENKWTSSYASRVVEEYKKFLFLCCALPNGASPSDAVDKAWHLHLTYTVNYWTDLCQNTLQHELHHYPSKGGQAEKNKHQNWYAETLQWYTKIFKGPPPPDIWPVAADEPPVFFDIYDRKLLARSIVIFSAAVLLGIFSWDIYHMPGEDFLIAFAILCAAALGLTWFLQWHKQKRLEHFITDYFPWDASLYQKAKFLYGAHRSYQSMLVDMLSKGQLHIDVKTFHLNDAKEPGDENPLVASLQTNLLNGKEFSYLEGYDLLDKQKIEHPKLQMLYQLSRKVDYSKFFIPGIVFIVFFIRWVQGLSNNRPVSFLVAEAAVFFMLSMMLLARYSYTKQVFKIGKASWISSAGEGKGHDTVTLNFALLGLAAITSLPDYSYIKTNFAQYNPINHSSTSGDGSYGACGSSCSSGGGGGCGSGCGGCGGD